MKYLVFVIAMFILCGCPNMVLADRCPGDLASAHDFSEFSIDTVTYKVGYNTDEAEMDVLIRSGSTRVNVAFLYQIHNSVCLIRLAKLNVHVYDVNNVVINLYDTGCDGIMDYARDIQFDMVSIDDMSKSEVKRLQGIMDAFFKNPKIIKLLNIFNNTMRKVNNIKL